MRDRVRERPAPSLLLDWLMAIAGVGVVGGLYIDGHAHLFQPVESFFTPWHAMMYGGSVFAVAVFGVTIVRNMRAGYDLWHSVPPGYQQTLAALPLMFVGGALDMWWHSIYGFEQRLDTLVSPTHMILFVGMFFIFGGPLRAGLLRGTAARSLIDQLPMLISLAMAIGVVQFVTQIAFYPEALMVDRPLSTHPGAYDENQLTIMVFTYYRQILGALVIIWQSLLLSGTMLYLALNVRLYAGALFTFAIFEKALLTGSISRWPSEMLLVTLCSALTGIVAEMLYARGVSCERPNTVRLFGAASPLAFYCAYFALAVPFFGGTWWDPSFLLGSIAYGGLSGLLVGQLYIGGYTSRRASSA